MAELEKEYAKRLCPSWRDIMWLRLADPRASR
jgi:hypothetical protein